MKAFLVVLALFASACVAVAQFDERPIRTRGIVSLEVFPGPPNYESIKGGDAREEAWILTTANNERFHLVILGDGKEKFAILRSCLGRKVRVDGTIWDAHTGHHRTPFLITVWSIEEEPNQSPQSRSRGSLLVVKSKPWVIMLAVVCTN